MLKNRMSCEAAFKKGESGTLDILGYAAPEKGCPVRTEEDFLLRSGWRRRSPKNKLRHGNTLRR
jgi:hypothetical protein